MGRDPDTGSNSRVGGANVCGPVIQLWVRRYTLMRGSIVSPAYGYIGSALVKCSNDGGPGPRHNMKGDPGSSIFSMPMVYGYYLHPFDLF
jgi:hypothetical protein